MANTNHHLGQTRTQGPTGLWSEFCPLVSTRPPFHHVKGSSAFLSSRHPIPPTPGPHRSTGSLRELGDSRDLTEEQSYRICPLVTGWPLSTKSSRPTQVAGDRMSFLLEAE